MMSITGPAIFRTLPMKHNADKRFFVSVEF